MKIRKYLGEDLSPIKWPANAERLISETKCTYLHLIRRGFDAVHLLLRRTVCGERLVSYIRRKKKDYCS